ncbi:MAG TPA: hypothetical protein VEA15_07940 [Caulobacteraceae bacterium]|nr:hypothetical protein [Caulobacteraceae bacterium]
MSALALGLGLPAGAGAVRDPDAAAIMAAMAVPPGEVRAGQVDRLVTALKGCGVWQKLDSLFVFAAHHEQAARIDWKQPARVAVAHGDPVFEPDRGWAFDGVDDYLATGFVPFEHCTQATGTAGCHGIYERTNLPATGVYSYAASMTSSRNLAMIARTAGDLCAGSHNHSATGAQVVSTDSRGLWVYQRDTAAGEYFRNGVSQGAVQPTAPGNDLVALEVYVGARNANGTVDGRRASRPTAFFVGAAMNLAEHAAFYRALQGYMSAAGAGV